jgi:hypothetical protein
MKKFVLVLAMVLGGLAAFVATRPAEFLVVRSRMFAAPPEVVHAYVNDLHRWSEWSPWEKLDPALRSEHAGAPEGPGASYQFAGNEQAGEGRMTITDSRAPDSVTLRLELVRPFPATHTLQFDMLHTGLGTEVTWSLSGRNDFLGKARALVFDVDQLFGPRFEQGLAALDAVTAAAHAAAEAEAAAAALAEAAAAPAAGEGAAEPGAAPPAPGAAEQPAPNAGAQPAPNAGEQPAPAAPAPAAEPAAESVPASPAPPGAR